MLANILFYGGIILGTLGVLNIIRFDGEFKRYVICGIIIIVGTISALVGWRMRVNTQDVPRAEIVEVQNGY